MKQKTESVQSKKVPFFARFLQGQDHAKVKSDVKAGCGPGKGNHTCKWPSDGDDGGPTS